MQQKQEQTDRRGRLGVGEQRLELTQDAAHCRLAVSRATVSIGADGGQSRIEVSAHSACRWAASSSAPWAVVSPSSAAGTTAVLVTVQPNAGCRRAATLTIVGQQLTLTQLARSSPPPPPPPAPSP